jgi:hypothetical protein
MRKILLGTTAVVGAALLTATVAQAQTAPTVRVGGFIQVLGHYLDDDADKPNGAGTGAGGGNANSRDKLDFRNELEVVVNVAGKAANGLGYGAVIEIQNDNGRGGSTNFDVDEAYLFISSPTLGTVRFGDAPDDVTLFAGGLVTTAVTGTLQLAGSVSAASTKVITLGAATLATPLALTTAGAGGNLNVSNELRPELGALGIVSCLFVLGSCPFGMA